MSSTQDIVQYTISAGLGGNTAAGTSFNGEIAIYINPGSDFNDAEAWALHDALVAALPAAWNMQSTDVSVYKMENVQTEYTSSYSAKTFS